MTTRTGGQILALLDAEGVGTAGARRIAGARSSRNAVLVDDRGERLICTYTDSALDHDPSWLPVASLAGCGAVRADVRWPRGAARAFEAALALRVPTVLDADVAPIAALRELSARCDYAIFSQPGLSTASGVSDPREGLRCMREIVRGVVGVTLGADGFLWLEHEVERHAAAPRVMVVDTLAAGDVFHGAFAVAIAEGADVSAAAAFANAAAALKCTRSGGRDGAPTRAEVDALLARQSLS